MILILLLATRDSGKSRIWHRQEGKCGKGLEIEGVLEGESLDEPIISTEDRRVTGLLLPDYYRQVIHLQMATVFTRTQCVHPRIMYGHQIS